MQGRYRGLPEGLLCLFLCGASLVGSRIYFMGNKPPEFAPSDNPASDSDSALTRALTYHFLPALNAWLLLFPARLSFDWSMSAVPLLEGAGDPRNLATLLFYACLGYVGVRVVRSLDQRARAPRVRSKQVHANGNGVAAAGSSSQHSHFFSHIQSSGRSQSPAHSHSNSNSSSSSSSFTSSPSHRRTSNGSAESVSPNSSSPSLSSSSVSSVSLNVLIMSLSMVVFPFIPASNLFFYVGFVIAERILYIPSMGFCLLVAHGAHLLSLRSRSAGGRRGVALAALLVIAAFSARTWRRNQDWQTEEKLYTAGIAVNPAKGRYIFFLVQHGTFVCFIA